MNKQKEEMKELIKNSISFILYAIYPFSFHKWIQKQREIIRSLWLLRLFDNCDTTVRFGRIGKINGPSHISVGRLTCFGDNLYLTTWDSFYTNSYDVTHDGKLTGPNQKGMYKQCLTPCLIIGERCNFGAFNHITCTNKVHIGKHVLTGKWVTNTDNSHGAADVETLAIPPLQRPLISKGPVVIEDNVWIGDKATILPGVTIGEGAVIAANAVVTKNVPPYSVVAGSPAKVIRAIDK